jgi:hypothetical protein
VRSGEMRKEKGEEREREREKFFGGIREYEYVNVNEYVNVVL